MLSFSVTNLQERVVIKTARKEKGRPDFIHLFFSCNLGVSNLGEACLFVASISAHNTSKPKL